MENFELTKNVLEVFKTYFNEENQKFKDYKKLVEVEKVMTPTEFFDDYILDKKLRIGKLRSQFLALTAPELDEEKALVAGFYYAMLILFPDEEIENKMRDFGLVNLKLFTPLQDIIEELENLEARGFNVSYYYAVKVSEGILSGRCAFEVGKISGLYDEYRSTVLAQSRLKNPVNISHEIPGLNMSGLYQQAIEASSYISPTTVKQFTHYQKKISVGKHTVYFFINLKNSILNEMLNSHQYYREMVPLTTLLLKKEPKTEDEFLLDSKIKNYNTYLSRWAKKIWTKKS